MRAILVRLMDNGQQTLGRLFVLDGFDTVFSCYTLEPAWDGNKTEVSCIPAGDYNLRERSSTKFGNHLAVVGVPDRTAILVHAGNYRADTKGCILVGYKLGDLNGDGATDVANSKATLKALLYTLKTPCPIHVVGV